MLEVTKPLPEDPAELRAFTALLLAEVKSQAVLIAKLRHQLAGQCAHRFGAIVGDIRAVATGAGE